MTSPSDANPRPAVGGSTVDVAEIGSFVTTLDGVPALRPGPGDGTPEIAWGDLFSSYAPDRVVPPTHSPSPPW